MDSKTYQGLAINFRKQNKMATLREASEYDVPLVYHGFGSINEY